MSVRRCYGWLIRVTVSAIALMGPFMLRGQMGQVQPTWPAKLLAPYAFIPYADAASSCLRETGQRYFILAFVLSDDKGKPAWDGQRKMRVRKGFYSSSIQAIRAQGGDVIVSFGGAGGQELALATPDPKVLAGKYQAAVDRYQLTWLDFDLEGGTLANQPVNERRNLALQQLQASHPGLRVTFTLPGNPTGLGEDALRLLANAKGQGVKIESVNVMTMDYAAEVRAGAKMGDLAISAVTAAHQQLAGLGLVDTLLGITPMIGENDVKSVVFGLDDAAEVLSFVQQTSWMRSVSFWSVNRDQAKVEGNDNSGIKQEKWGFTRLLQPLSR